MSADYDAGGTARLCKNGQTASGCLCTGSAHVGQFLIRCTDASHKVALPGPPPPTFTELLNDPTQQLDSEGAVLRSVLDEQERDRLRAEGWRACVEHLQARYNRETSARPAHVPYVMLDGEDLYFLRTVHNPWRKRPLPPGEGRA